MIKKFHFIIRVLVPAGLPDEVLERAAVILDTLKNDNQVEKLGSENIIAQDQQYKDAVEKLIAFNAQKDPNINVKAAATLNYLQFVNSFEISKSPTIVVCSVHLLSSSLPSAVAAITPAVMT
ncbi:hypothetical protein FXO38_13844 [Capsicum annuum]|nr:hypothetical protein FXO37_32904 [Capsicum annuum]KAF3657111.1 hypothetical protein FXO38_13844 [Capsicum annuum]